MAARSLAAACVLTVAVCAVLHAAVAHTVDTTTATAPTTGGGIYTGGIGTACNTSSNCSADMECLNGTCRCSNNSDLVNGNCVSVPPTWGGPCESIAQCSFWNRSVCLNNICACPIGLTFVRRACNNITAPPCSGSTCPGGASCTGGRCVCPMDQLYVDGRCVATQGKIGGNCNPNLLCYLPNDNDEQHVACTALQCECTNGYQPNSNNDSCVSGASLAFVSSAMTVLLALVVSKLT